MCLRCSAGSVWECNGYGVVDREEGRRCWDVLCIYLSFELQDSPPTSRVDNSTILRLRLCQFIFVIAILIIFSTLTDPVDSVPPRRIPLSPWHPLLPSLGFYQVVVPSSPRRLRCPPGFSLLKVQPSPAPFSPTGKRMRLQFMLGGDVELVGTNDIRFSRPVVFAVIVIFHLGRRK